MNCKKLKTTMKNVFNFMDEALNSSLILAHSITNEVAKIIGNPLFQLSLSMLPAGINIDVVLEKIEAVLKTTEGITRCESLTGIEKVNCLIAGLNLMPKDKRDSKLLLLASTLTALFDGYRFKKVVYDSAAQINYLNQSFAAGKPLAIDEKERKPFDSGIDLNKALKALTGSQLKDSTFAQPLSEVPQEVPQIPSAVSLATVPPITDLPGFRQPEDLIKERDANPAFTGAEQPATPNAF